MDLLQICLFHIFRFIRYLTTDRMPLLRNDAVHKNIVLFGGQEGQVLI